MTRHRRKQKRTVLIYCEGLHDMIFMKHLKSLYASGNSSVHFEIKSSTGGAPVSITRGALKVVGSFDMRIAKFDNDLGKDALNAAYRVKNGVELTYCTPAIEATLLEILEPSKSYHNYATQTCKRRLHQKYISENDRINLQKYNDKFGINVLNEARTRHPVLDHLIKIFEEDVRWRGYSQNNSVS